MTADRVVPWLTVGAVTAFVVWQLFPEHLLRDSTPTQGDLGPHIHEPAHLREHLLPWLSGWSQDWFTGYPSLIFYFPLGALLVVLVDVLLPYNVAFKLVAAAGPATLPLAAYAFGRLHERSRAASAALAVSVLPLLLQQDLYQAGGSIGSAAIGEYGYGLSLSTGLLLLGVTAAGLRTGRHRVLAAGLLAVSLLLHVVPTALAIVGIAVSVAMRPSRAAVRWAVPTVAAGLAVAGFWAVPFVLRGRFTTGPDYPKSTPTADWLLPGFMVPVAVVAAIGLFAAFRDRGKRDRLPLFLAAMALVSAVAFALTPAGRVADIRFLPHWFLWLCLLAGYALTRTAEAVEALQRKRTGAQGAPSPSRAALAVPLIALLVVLPLWDSRLGKGVLTKQAFDFTVFAEQFFEGYETSRYRDEYTELVGTLRTLGREHGCGRAHWEWDQSTWTDNRVGVMQLLPYLTDGCIGSTEGLYQQAAATSLYVHTSNGRLSTSAVKFSDDQPTYDLEAGLADLRLLGVRYFLTSHALTQDLADESPQLRFLSRTSDHGEGRFWNVYELSDVALVEPLPFEPVVVRGIGASRSAWEKAALDWYAGRDDRAVVLAAAGPDRWRRVDGRSGNPPRRPATSTDVTEVRIDNERISFSVSQVGTPVLVKVSYFPNWKASGARGPWRVTPNQMVVVPTSRDVVLRYGPTPVEYGGLAVSLLGVGGLVALGRRGPVDIPRAGRAGSSRGRADEAERRHRKRRRGPPPARPARPEA